MRHKKLLYHFIGRDLGSDDDRYDILIKILRDGFLQPTQSGENAYFFESEGLIGPIQLDKRFPVSFIDRDWCDNAAFKKHMEGYSKFALGFEKQFILNEGGNPVFYYFDSSSPTTCLLRNSFNIMMKHFKRLEEIFKGNKLELNELSSDKSAFKDIMNFVKPFNFDDTNKDKDVYNEREWRIIATDGDEANPFWNFKVTPAIKGIRCAVREIIVPKAYYKKVKMQVNKLIPRNAMPRLVVAEDIGTFFDLIKHAYCKWMET